MAFICDNSGYVFIQVILVLARDKVLSSLDSEYNLYIDLRIGVCHT